VEFCRYAGAQLGGGLILDQRFSVGFWGEDAVAPNDESVVRAIALNEVPTGTIIEGVASSSRTVASSLFAVLRDCGLVVPDPRDGVAGYVAQVDGGVVYR
jgi:hypothetical protein